MKRLCAMLTLVVSLSILVVGCSSTAPDRDVRMTRSYVYYLDGAGGAGLITNWSRGVRRGFVDAGYDGAGEVFVWQTGLGTAADQAASVKYKRTKASELARRMKDYSKNYPQAPVTVMGLSAGTAIVLFTLEACSDDYQVANALLLASSVSANYDLTKALRHVEGKMYVFTSENDAVLRFLVPMAGTADRQSAKSAGLSGFRRPPSASADTRKQYAKVVHIRWQPEFRKAGHGGGHTDVVNASFVKAYVAPLVMKAKPHRAPTAAAAPEEGMVRNPDYDRWVSFEAGSWIEAEGYEVIGGVRHPLRLTATLMARDDQKVAVEWSYVVGKDQEHPTRVQNFIEHAWVKPEDHPYTHPTTKSTLEPKAKSITVKGKPLACDLQTAHVEAEFPDWGKGIDARLYHYAGVPGGIVQFHIKSSKDNQPFEFFAKVVDYKVVKK